MSSTGSPRSRFDAWIKRLYEQKPHGPGDEIGSLNYLDDAARERGRQAIGSGTAVSLGRTLRSTSKRADGTVDTEGPSTFELEFFTTPSVAPLAPEGYFIQTDRLQVEPHGMDNTHIDALNHQGFGGRWYDGTSTDTPGTGGSLDKLAAVGIFTRAVYVDIAAARGVDYLDEGPLVTADEIAKGIAAAGVTFEPGDALLLDGGRDRYESGKGQPWGATSPRPGAGREVAEWLEAHRPSLLCWDMLDGEDDEDQWAPVHTLNWAIGLVLVDNCDFSRARPAFAGRTPRTAGLVVAPMAVPGATGNNVNPLLIL